MTGKRASGCWIAQNLKGADAMGITDVVGVLAMTLSIGLAWWYAKKQDLCRTLLFCFLFLADCVLIGG